MEKDLKKELLIFLDYLESKIEDVYADEVSESIKEFKKEYLR